MTSPDYLLGHREPEWERLEEQHALWRDSLLEPIRALGLGRNASVLEVGCGPGALLADLGALTDGRVEAIERDAAAADRARKRSGERAVVRVGDLYEEDLGGPWDLIVARWVFSFLPDPGRALERIWTATKPGGHVVLQDYDHDALGVWPRDPAIDRVIEAFRAAYRSHGGDLWVGAKLPQAFAALGARAEVVPIVRAGQPGDAVWSWVERFLFEHIETVVSEGHLAESERQSFETAWQRQRETPGALLVTPLQMTVTARRALG